MNENFDTSAQNFAEIIDEILQAERSRARRLELIRHHVRRAMSTAYKVGLRRAASDLDQRAAPENEIREGRRHARIP
jgi:hypothetical protein